MISNDMIIVEFFDKPIGYGDNTTIPLTKSTVIFPPTDYMNIQEWIDLVNITFQQVKVKLAGYKKLNEILQLDWSFFPYKFTYMTNETIYIKSAIIKFYMSITQILWLFIKINMFRRCVNFFCQSKIFFFD